MATIAYSLESGVIEMISSISPELAYANLDTARFGIIEADIVRSPGVQDRYIVVDGELVDQGQQPNALVLKGIRDTLLDRTDWLCRRQEDQLRQGRATSLTEQQYDELLDYRQDLRDWPTSEVCSEPFPTKPSWLV